MSRNTSSPPPADRRPEGKGRADGDSRGRVTRDGKGTPAQDEAGTGKAGHPDGPPGPAPDGTPEHDGPGAPAGKTGRVALFRPGPAAQSAPLTIDQRTGQLRHPAPGAFAPLNPAKVWRSLTAIAPSPAALAAHGLVWGVTDGPGPGTFDMLRTRVLQAMARRDWLRLGVTAPEAGSGASFVAANLALSAAQLPSCRTLLLDLDLRSPALASRFGLTERPALVDCLTGDQPFEAHFRRLGENLALGLNAVPVSHSAETLQHPAFAESLLALRDMLEPDLMIFDLPPALASDDVLALAPQLDAVLLVIDGTQSAPDRVRACLRLFEGQVPVLGTVLNRARDRNLRLAAARGG